jgi:hypothetical protein
LQAQRCHDAEKASQADELKAAAAAVAADAASNAAREAKDAQRQLQQELHDEQRRCALLSQDVEYLRQATARLETTTLNSSTFLLLFIMPPGWRAATRS